MTPKQMAELSQATAALRDVMPALWWGVYSGMKEQGFSDYQAMELLKSYITATNMRISEGRADGPANSD